MKRIWCKKSLSFVSVDCPLNQIRLSYDYDVIPVLAKSTLCPNQIRLLHDVQNVSVGSCHFQSSQDGGSVTATGSSL